MRMEYYSYVVFLWVLLLTLGSQAQQHHQQQAFLGNSTLPPAPEQPTATTTLTLKTIYHHSSPNGPIPRLFRRLNLPTATIQQQQQQQQQHQEAQQQYTFSPIIGQYERLNKHAKNYLIQQASPSVLSATLNLPHRYQPRKVRWKRLAELTALNTDILKEPVEDYIPDVTSHSTVLALALMTSNAYIETDNTTDWYDLGEPWQLNKSFGWQDDGIRGHVFGNFDNSLFVISFKGTSVGLMKEPTGDKDKINASICLYLISRAWTPVCECYQDNDYVCKIDCLEESILKTEFYYDHAMEIYLNVANQYPNATIWLAGHSLGGALASLVGQTYGIPAVSFEAPGDQLASMRLHLPHYNNMPLWHFGHTADPIFIGDCIGPASTCWYGGFAMEAKCHTGKLCVWDMVQNEGWRVDARKHRIKNVIDEILNRTDGPPIPIPPCKKERGCSDCHEWAYPDRRGMITTTTPPPMSTTGLDTRPRRYSFFDYDLDVVQDALLNPHLSEYQDHFGFRIQVKTDDEYDDDTSEDDVDLDNSNNDNDGDDDGPTDTSHDTQSHPSAIPLQLGMKAASPSSSSSITTTITTSSSSADEDDDYTDIDIDTAITTPTVTKHSHLSESSLVSEGEALKLDTNGYPQQRRRSSTVSGTTIAPATYSKSSPPTAAPLSKPYRRPRAMSYSVTQTTALVDDKGITSAPPPSNHTIMHGSYTPPISTITIATTTKIKAPPSRPLSTATSLSRHSSVERPSDVFRNRQSKRLSLHRTGSIALSSSTPHNEDSAQQLALKEEVSNNLAQLKEASPDIYDWEFWATVINDFDMVKQQQHISLRDYVCVGMPPSLRGMIWQVVSKSRHNSDTIELEYNALLKMVSPHEKIIQRDLARTFPTHTFFRHSEEGGGQEMLFNVIKAYSLYDPQVGYCQGLPFVVGCLLLHMPDEAAFCVLINLMNDYGLRGHFTPKMELLHERMFQFDELLLVHLPQVHRHLDAQGVRPTMYASQWFMTLFAYRCPLDLVFRVLDMVFTEGTSIILNVALALMKKNQATLLSLEFEGLLGFLGTDIFDVYEHDTNGFVKDAFDFCIAPRDLVKLTKRYMVKAAQEAKIQDKEDHLRQENYELSQRAKKLEKSYEALTFEHQELTRQVVAAKMTMASASDENQSLRHTIAHLEHCIKHTKQLTEESQLDTFHHLAHENATLVQRNVQLEDHLAEVEMTLIDFKMKYAQSENEYEQMKKMLGQIKRFSS